MGERNCLKEGPCTEPGAWQPSQPCAICPRRYTHITYPHEGSEEGSTCNREVIDLSGGDGCTTTRCTGTMVLKVEDNGPGNQTVYLECNDCLSRYPE